MTRTLVVVRHAKAQPSHPLGDHERELADRGVADAQALGRWLQEEELRPDVVVVSTAARARQTADHALAGAGAEAQVWPERSVYDGGPEGVLEAVRAVPEAAATVWVVGHEPTASQLVLVLAGPWGSSAAALARLRDGLPTASAAVLRLGGAWSDLGEGMARLQSVHAVRG